MEQVRKLLHKKDSSATDNDVIDFSKFNPFDTSIIWATVKKKVRLRELNREDLVRPHIETEEKLRFVCLSDTHTCHDEVQVPSGDVLVITGDISMRGGHDELESFNTWVGELPFRHKIIIAGNHDMSLDKNRRSGSSIDGHSFFTNCTYLQDEAIEVEGYKIYGSPWVPNFGYWAFMKSRTEIKSVWDEIPQDTDILLTHGPPLGVLDECESGALAGCMHLLDCVINRVKPTYHIFGHIHESNGINYSELSGTTFINASTCTVRYRADNEPFVFELPKKHSEVAT